MPNRHGQDEDYRYGFQGQEMDDEIRGSKGTSVNYKYRMHDTRIGRFFATDPLEMKFCYYSPYHFSSNSPIVSIELEGLESSYQLNYQEKSVTITVNTNNQMVISDVEFAKLDQTHNYTSGVHMGSDNISVAQVDSRRGSRTGTPIYANVYRADGSKVSIRVPTAQAVRTTVTTTTTTTYRTEVIKGTSGTKGIAGTDPTIVAEDNPVRSKAIYLSDAATGLPVDRADRDNYTNVDNSISNNALRQIGKKLSSDDNLTGVQVDMYINSPTIEKLIKSKIEAKYGTGIAVSFSDKTSSAPTTSAIDRATQFNLKISSTHNEIKPGTPGTPGTPDRTVIIPTTTTTTNTTTNTVNPVIANP